MQDCFSHNNKKNTKFYHYTSQESFYEMFKDYIKQLDMEEVCNNDAKYVYLYASQMQYLNDKQEYKEGLKIIQEDNVPVSDVSDSIFVSCFCGKEDLLSQWKYYGKNCGIAIQFDFNKSVNLCWFNLIKNLEQHETPLVYWPNIRPYNVIYKHHNENYKRIKEVVNKKVYKDIAVQEAANIFVPYCKNENFIEESESRLIFYPIKSTLCNGDLLLTNIEYRVNKGKIVPQFKCKIAYGDKNKSKNQIPVKSIMVGPGHNQRLVFNSIINMLEPNKSVLKFYNDEEIDLIIKNPILLKGKNQLGLYKGRISYKTSNGIVISMSAIPFRD